MYVCFPGCRGTVMILETLQYYWPRILLGVWFAFVNSSITARRGNKRNFIRDFLILFCFSCTTVAIVNEKLSGFLFERFYAPAIASYSSDTQTVIFLAFSLFNDAISLILPIYLFKKVIHERFTVAATVYMMYVILDRMCLIMAVSAFSYFAILLIVLILGVALFAKRMQFVVNHSDSIEWEPVMHYQLGLFFLLDALYAVYYVFPGINNGKPDLKNLWIDSIVIVSFGFFIGFARLNIKASGERAEKLEYMQELQESERSIIMKFSEISEAKSGETGQHVRRVAEYSALLAKEYGFSDDEVGQIRIASMMHDVGKLLVPREIIEKPGKLTDDEVKIMRLHTTYGDNILSNSKGEEIVMARQIAGQHHEWWDGSGYPKGLSGDEISPYAQIVAVADVYDALTSRRSYKEPWDSEAARQEILSQSGSQFSPIVVEVFDRSFDKILEIQKTYADE